MARRRAVRRIPPPLTLALDSVAELQAFRASTLRRWKLPRLRVALRVPGLRSARCQHYDRLINRELGRNGGWAALSTAAACTLGAVFYPLPPAGVESFPALSAWVAEVALGWIVGWFAGHGGVRLLAHWRIARTCSQAGAEAAAGRG